MNILKFLKLKNDLSIISHNNKGSHTHALYIRVKSQGHEYLKL